MIPSLTPTEQMVLEMLWDLTEGEGYAPADTFTDEQLLTLYRLSREQVLSERLVVHDWRWPESSTSYCLTLAGMGALLPVYVAKLARANERADRAAA